MNFTDCIREVRVAARSLRRSPAFTASAVLVLAVGIATCALAYGLIDAVLLEPLPYDRPGELFEVRNVHAVEGRVFESSRVADDVLAAWRDGSRTARFAAVRDARHETVFYLAGSGEPARLIGAMVSPDYFELLGARAALGRTLEPADAGTDVVVLSNGVWLRQFGGDPGIVGREIRLNGVAYTVAGIMTRDFQVPRPPVRLEPAERIELWVPMRANPARAIGDDVDHVIARIGTGTDVRLAEAELARIARSVAPAPAGTERRIRLEPIERVVIAGPRDGFAILAAVAALALVLTCTSIGTLLLARFTGRADTAAVRAALGASGIRLIAHEIAEGVLIACAGGLMALAMTAWGQDVVRWLAPADLPRIDQMRVGGRLIAFLAAVTVFASFVAALPAALLHARGVRARLVRAGHGGPATPGLVRMRAGLVVAQLAIALTLLVGGGVLVRSLLRLSAVGAAIDTGQVVVVDLYRPPGSATGAGGPAGRDDFHAEVARRVGELPGVTAVGLASSVPFRPRDYYGPEWRLRVIDGGYFEALGTRLIAGRAFDARDEGGPAVAIVSAALARARFGSADPIGATLDDMTIVGVAPDLPHVSLDETPEPAVYVPAAQRNEDRMSLLVKTGLGAAAVAPAIRRIVAEVDPRQPVHGVASLERIAARSTAVSRRRFQYRVIAALACFATLLGTLAVYATGAQAVSERTREIGLRMALGATGSEVTKLILRRAALLVLAGCGVGLAGAALLTRVLRASLFQVGAADPVTIVGAIVLLAATTMIASAIPALRATAVDPMAVLRSD